VFWTKSGFDHRPHPLTRLVYGAGRLAQTGELVDAVGGTRALLVTSPSVRRTGLADRVGDHLGRRLVGVFDGVRPHSPIEVVEQAREASTSAAADVVVSVGGGSSVDTAKGIVHLVRERTGRRLPHVAIPTTLSGAEFTYAAGITHGRKKRIYGPDLFCEVVLLDPEAAAVTPCSLFLPSGLNAVAHCVEGVQSVDGSAVAEAMMLHAIRLLSESLRAVQREPEDLEARGRAQAGAALASMGIWGVSVGLEHALAHAVGGKYKAPHATVHAILIAPVMRFNHRAVVRAQAAIAEALGVPRNGDEAAAGRRGIERITALLIDLGIPTGLRALGVTEDGLGDLAEAAFHDPCFATNPRPVSSREDVVEVLRSAL
jgi:alcohol dehydrogenase class IV